MHTLQEIPKFVDIAGTASLLFVDHELSWEVVIFLDMCDQRGLSRLVAGCRLGNTIGFPAHFDAKLVRTAHQGQTEASYEKDVPKLGNDQLFQNRRETPARYAFRKSAHHLDPTGGFGPISLRNPSREFRSLWPK